MPALVRQPASLSLAVQLARAPPTLPLAALSFAASPLAPAACDALSRWDTPAAAGLNKARHALCKLCRSVAPQPRGCAGVRAGGQEHPVSVCAAQLAENSHALVRTEARAAWPCQPP